MGPDAAASGSGATSVADGPDDLVAPSSRATRSLAAAAGARLIGRGGGLTPEGDDLVAGVAAVVAVAAWPAASREAWLAALVGADLRTRTTALSATLLELAAAGMGPEPLQALLAGDAARARAARRARPLDRAGVRPRRGDRAARWRHATSEQPHA